MELHIIYQDNHLLVVRKPAGIAVQRDNSGDESLLDLAKTWLKVESGKQGNVYLGLVHRLDRPVSGVIVFAKTSKAAARLSEQFREREVKKVYHALAEGIVPEEGTLEDNITRKGATSRIAEGDEGQPARLHFKRLGHEKNISLVEIDLSTGRHHQIRLQFAHRGHPLLGDFRYGSKIVFGDRCVALHASSLTLTHPTLKEEMAFEAKPDVFWKEFYPLP